MLEVIKRYVTSDMKTDLTCPECQKTKQADVSRFIQLQTQISLKCKCNCGHKFNVFLERRRSIRKNFSFPGWIIHANKKKKARIKDLSRHGMRIKLIENSPLQAGQTVGIQFNVDDPMKSPVSRDVLVKRLFSPNEYGCEFLSFEHRGNLGKFFLFYF